eukprot:UN18312
MKLDKIDEFSLLDHVLAKKIAKFISVEIQHKFCIRSCFHANILNYNLLQLF